MELFIDTADLKHIHEYAELGILSGVTTNPSLIAKGGRDIRSVIREICDLIDGPVSAEVVATTTDDMVREGESLAALHPGVVVKLPFGKEGIRACTRLKKLGVATNVTLVFSSNQALVAAEAGSDFISPFAGRLDDIGHDGIGMVLEAQEVLTAGGYESRIIAASIRSPGQVVRLATSGVDIATLPPAILDALFSHPLTEAGIQKFLEDWKGAGEERTGKILPS